MSHQAMKKPKCILLSERRQFQKATFLLQAQDILEMKTFGDSIEISGSQQLGGMEGWINEPRGFSGEWNYSVWYYNGRSVSLYFCQDAQNLNCQKWTRT